MYILGNLIIGLASVTDAILFLAQIMVIASVIISWVNADPYNPIVRTINMFTLPIYKKVQQKIPTTYGSLDLTPLIVLLAIMFIQSGILPSVYQIGTSLKV